MHPSQTVAQLAASQYGVVGRRQLTEAGLGPEWIDRQLAARRLCRVHAGVYALVPSRLLKRHGRYLAAVIACGDGALVSHRDAGTLWKIRAGASGAIDITVPRGRTRTHRGIVVHTTRAWHPDDISERAGIPCTSLPRTLVDLAAVERPHRLERALELAQHERIFDGRTIAAALERANGRRGVARLRHLLAELSDEPPPTRTEIERCFLRLVRNAGLPPPKVNEHIGKYEVDFHWPAHRLVVETDGRATHGTDQAFEEDRRRDLYLRLAGWDVMPFTWRQVTRESAQVTEALRRRLR